MSEDHGHTSARFFAILMPWGRVGSNLVVAALAASRSVVIENEPATRIKTFGLRDGLSPEEIGDQQFEHLEEFHERHRDGGQVAVLKLSYRSLIDPSHYMARLASLGARPILMVRENFLKCAVSQMRANARAKAPPEKRKHWQSPWSVSSTESKPGPVPLDPTIAIRLAREFETFHHALVESAEIFGSDVMKIEYRELASNPKAVIRSIYSVFGLPAPGVIQLPYKKATSDVLCEDISNFAEFADAVRDAGLERFLANNC